MIPLLFVLHPYMHGARWAIYRASEAQFREAPLQRCVNAGFSDTITNADIVGQLALYTILSFADTLGLRCTVTPLTLDDCPIPVASTEDLIQGLSIVADGQVLQMGVN